MTEVFNFSAGPAMMPHEVMQKTKDEFLNWNNTGVSIAEISHRTPLFMEIANQSIKDCRELLKIPDHYHVLFLPGGSRTQFAAVPMNLLREGFAAYVQTGYWGKCAAIEAARYGRIKNIVNTESSGYVDIPSQNTWGDFSDAAYLHYVDNETIHGVEFHFIPDSKDVPLVCDMSSNILSRPFDVSKYGLIYACSQKNISIAGVTIVIIRDDLLKRQPMSSLPSIMNYNIQVKNDSMLNTPNTFSWYMAGLVFQWLKKQGGVEGISKINAKKAAKLYAYLDSQDFYTNNVVKNCRSRMNVVFTLPSVELETQFVEQAKKAGLFGLKGHKILGGIRASIYNAMPMKGVEKLIGFMDEFKKV